MHAVRIRRTNSKGIAYSETNPAPPSALRLETLPKPTTPQRGQFIVQVRATSVIRDSLAWPGLYSEPAVHLGNDFAGIVTEVHSEEQEFRPGDQVYGMTAAGRGGTWAEYALVSSREASHKPASLTWDEAAALPLSALTADQALFVHGRLEYPAQIPKRILVTGAGGCVGSLVVALAASAGYHVVAATSSSARNESFLSSLGAKQCIEYGSLTNQEKFHVVIDTAGGTALAGCWRVVHDEGSILSVDTASWNFAEEHQQKGISTGKESVRAVFFVVEPSRDSLARVTAALGNGLKDLVAKAMPFTQVKEAYDLSYSKDVGRGRIVLKL